MIIEILTLAILLIALSLILLLLANGVHLVDVSSQNEIYRSFDQADSPFENGHQSTLNLS